MAAGVHQIYLTSFGESFWGGLTSKTLDCVLVFFSQICKLGLLFAHKKTRHFVPGYFSVLKFVKE